MANRQFVSFPFSDLYRIKQQVLNWSARFGTCCFLDNQGFSSDLPGYETLCAVGERAAVKAASGNAFAQLQEFSRSQADWIFGHFSFDLKSETEQSPSALPDPIGFPDLFFFVPEIVLVLMPGTLQIGLYGDRHRQVWEEIEACPVIPPSQTHSGIRVQPRISRPEYIETVQQLRRHILRGDCYEINFCQEFFAENATADPLALFGALRQISPSPFSAYYTCGQKFLLCASPERYLKKTGNRIISQPIKGTAPRNTDNPLLDEALRNSLAQSEKDRAENVMVVDLVRNDLSKICEADSVWVSELFGLYRFAQVHQMISTIEGRARPGLHWTELIAKTFPMGSMTGAPKKRVLELTEQYEKTKRGLFSGAVGYITPEQDFDFNVVIRSLFYNPADRYLSFFAGSGITFNSDPELEYEECRVKVAAFEQILKNPSP